MTIHSLLDRSTPTAEQAARARLASEIAEIIKPYTTTPNEPPYKVTELIRMAAVCIKQDTFTKRGLFLWIVSTFRKIKERDLTLQRQGAWSFSRPYTYSKRFLDSTTNFRAYDLPISRTENDITPCEIEWLQLCTRTSAARTYLRRVLVPQRPGTFDFFGLPAELRMQIFEHVLTFSGLYIPTPSEVEGRSRGYAWDNRLVPIEGAYDPNPFPLGYRRNPSGLCRNCNHMHRLPPPEDLLQLFCVSKRMYAKAKPVFFSQILR